MKNSYFIFLFEEAVAISMFTGVGLHEVFPLYRRVEVGLGSQLGGP